MPRAGPMALARHCACLSVREHISQWHRRSTPLIMCFVFADRWWISPRTVAAWLCLVALLRVSHPPMRLW